MKILYIDCTFGFDVQMLLGALTDAGADAKAVQKQLNDKYPELEISVQSVKRNFIDCALVKAETSEDGDGVYRDAVMAAASNMKIDYVITSAVPLPDDADGEVIDVFEKSGIEMIPADKTPYITVKNALFLASFANECAPKPQMDILSVGYGTGEIDGFVIATTGYMRENDFFEKVQEKSGMLI